MANTMPDILVSGLVGAAGVVATLLALKKGEDHRRDDARKAEADVDAKVRDDITKIQGQVSGLERDRDRMWPRCFPGVDKSKYDH